MFSSSHYRGILPLRDFFVNKKKKNEKKMRWLSLWHLILRSVEQLKKEMSLTQHHLIYIFIKFNAGLSKKILKSISSVAVMTVYFAALYSQKVCISTILFCLSKILGDSLKKCQITQGVVSIFKKRICDSAPSHPNNYSNSSPEVI